MVKDNENHCTVEGRTLLPSPEIYQCNPQGEGGEIGKMKGGGIREKCKVGWRHDLEYGFLFMVF